MNGKSDIISLFEETVARSLRAAGVSSRHCRIGVALSGGADSVALLNAVVRLGHEAVALHCNFHLRGDESDADARFVAHLCRDLGVELHTADFDTIARQLGGESIEMTCRRLRYDWFEASMESLSLELLAVGHHIEDSVETVFINLLRGSGPKGLKGIDLRRGYIVRPLLPLSRRQIEEYLASIGQGYRTDSSNLSTDYRRNALRNVIIPAISSHFPDAQAGVAATMESMRLSQTIIDDFTQLIRGSCCHTDDDGTISVDLGRLTEMAPSSAPSTLFCLMKVIGHECSMTTARDIITRRHRSGSRFVTRTGSVFSLAGDNLTEERISHDEPIDFNPANPGNLPIRLEADIISPEEFAAGERTTSTAYFDADALSAFPMQLRHWRHGDRIKPFGMTGSRLVSDIFTDLKLSSSQKSRQWLLTCGEEVIWVVGVRASRVHSVTPSTSRVIRLRLTE